MSLIFTKELCMYIIDAADDYFLHHKLLMLSKPYYDYCNANKEQRMYYLICQFQYIEFSAEYGTQKCTYKINGIIHRIDNGPTVIRADGTKFWYRNNKLHRDHDLPAIIYTNGTQLWYRNGERHRDNGPARIYAYGGQDWLQNDKLHRDNGPAVIFANGNQYWYHNGDFIESGQ